MFIERVSGWQRSSVAISLQFLKTLASDKKPLDARYGKDLRQSKRCIQAKNRPRILEISRLPLGRLSLTLANAVGKPAG